MRYRLFVLLFLVSCCTLLSHAAELIHRNVSWSLQPGNDPILQITNQSDEGRTLTLRILIKESSYRYRTDFEVPSGENRFVRVREILDALVKRYPELAEKTTGLLQVEYEGADSDIRTRMVTLDQKAGITSEKEDQQQELRPVVKSIEPESGSPSGGTVVTIIGDNFDESTAVRFGGLPAMRTLQSRQTLIAIAPAHAAGSVAVEVINGKKTGKGQLRFSYEYNSPVLVSLEPDTGPQRGGTRVAVQGRNFQPGATVRWDAKSIPARFQSGELLTIVSPPGKSGAITVEVINPDGKNAQLTDAFTYKGLPEIRSVNPAMGGRAGGYSVTVSGSNFEQGSSVLFGGRYGQTTFINPSALAAVVPPGESGYTDITVSSPGGETVALQQGFLYNEPPVITAITAWPNPIVRNTTTTITVQAIDPEAGPLDYEYRVAFGPPGGTITAQGEQATYGSPDTTGKALIQVTVYDEHRSRTQGTVEVVVQ